MSQAINMAVVEELLALSDDGDPSLLVDLIQMFLDDAPTKVGLIKSGLTKSDLQQIERAAHSLKGSAGNLGAVHLQQLCDDLQRASRGAQAGELAALVGQLDGPLAAALQELRALLTQHSR